MTQLRVLTWHVHGAYLHYLSHVPHRFLVPVRPGRPPRYLGLPPGGFPWRRNLVEVDAGRVSAADVDVVLCQAAENWTVDRFELLGSGAIALPTVYLEHDPPRESPTDMRHVVDDPRALLVHVTPFNALMWDAGRTPTTVIDHGVPLPQVRWTGKLARGLAVVNDIGPRGRRLGVDVLEQARRQVPIDLVGMGSEAVGGLGEVPHRDLPAFAARYRFLFNPIRYTSLGLAVCEAMALGMPVVGLATTEMATAVENGVSGYVDTRLDVLVGQMRRLLDDHDLAARLGEGARRTAASRFALSRFVREWGEALRGAVELRVRRAA